MAFNGFLKIRDIPGESTDIKHQDWIEVLSFNFGISRAGSRPARGKAAVQDFQIVHKVDKASPLLFEACCGGDHIQEALFVASKAGRDQQDYIKITMSDVVVSGVNPMGSAGGSEEGPLENVGLAYGKIEIEYAPQRPDGTLGSPVKSSCSPRRFSLEDKDQS